MFLLVDGRPGVGKTTLLRTVTDNLIAAGVSVAGFYTEEVRDTNTRLGFDIVNIVTKNRAAFAREGQNYGCGFVAKYGVNGRAFEDVADLTQLAKMASKYQVLVFDEIGRMELKSSKKFIRLIEDLNSPTCKTIILASVPTRDEWSPLIKKLKMTWSVFATVTRGNRDRLAAEISHEIITSSLVNGI